MHVVAAISSQMEDLEQGNLDKVQHALVQNPDMDVDLALQIAATYGHLHLVKLLMEHDATDVDDALLIASDHGHGDIVRYLIGFGATEYHEAMVRAAIHGHLNVILLIASVCSNIDQIDYNLILEAAAFYGHLHIVKFSIKSGAQQLGDALVQAVENEQYEVSKFLVQKKLSVDDLLNAMDMAAQIDNFRLFDLIFRSVKSEITGRYQIEESLQQATHNNNCDIVQLLDNFLRQH